MKRVVGLAALFLVLTALGLGWAAVRGGFAVEDLAHLGRLQWLQLLLVALLAAGVPGFDALRFWAFGRMLGVPLSVRAACDSAVANAFFAWLTPGSALAEPATIVVLTRHGVQVAEAAVLCVLKSFTSVIVILAASVVVFAAGLAPPLEPWLLWPFASGTTVVLAAATVLGIAALWPEASVRAVLAGTSWGPRWPLVQRVGDGGVTSSRRLADLRRLSAGQGLLALALHVAYYACFVGTLVALLRGLGAIGPVATVSSAVVYQCFTYFAPTPGGAGLSEAAATSFFGHVVAAEDAVIAVVLFRSATFYLHIGLGLVYLPFVSIAQAASSQRATEEHG